MNKKLKVGLIGMGGRGIGMVKGVFLKINTTEVTAVCDLYPDRAEQGAKLISDKFGTNPMVTTNYMDVINNDDVEAVIIMSAWESHVEIALASMRAGKPVAVEVGCAYALEECWDLVKTYEETKTPIMMLENCCYGEKELMILNMVRKGLFGEIVHCKGGYQHDLRSEIADGEKNRHYRLRNYLNRNCHNYPTHEIGPISRILNINYGNRMVSLNSIASKAVGLKDFINTQRSDNEKLVNAKVEQGDVITTVIKCAHGETITLTLNTTLPRYYCRGLEVCGTGGIYSMEANAIFLDGPHTEEEEFSIPKDSADTYAAEHQHPIWDKYKKEGMIGYHGGMDGLVVSAFVDAVLNNTPMPIDVYDIATWMSISVLSEQSILKGGAPVEFPDYTKGAWTTREYKAEGFYSLN